ncbi:M15 family metallopeptidase [Planotetraspora phitsanulokensis]|nr:M15 family metallopeptidase [Planotetraspora phitsanulokensis]
MASLRNPRSAMVAVAVLGLTACGGTGVVTSSPAAFQTEASASPSTAAPSTPTPPPSPTPAGPPKFSAKIQKVSRADLPSSWHAGCPVSPSGLRKITMTYWGFDGKPHTGQLVVNQSAADDMVKVFAKLYGFRYPIRRMQPVDAYKGSDDASIDADNTSAFNCRNATGSSKWSNHAYGLAVDVNPRENPYVYADGSNAHRNADAFVRRPLKKPGVINADDRVVKAFASVGWGWGGSWSGDKDYQHFSENGR